VQYGYDAVGNRNRTTNARGQATIFAYDLLNRLTGIAYPGGSAVAYSYDAVGNRTQMVDSTGTTTYAYDGLNRVTGITNPGGRVVGYTYDDTSNRTAVTYPDGKVVTYTYDAANRLTRVTDWASHQTDYTYDNAGNLTGQANPNNTSASLTYDSANRLTGLIHTSTVSGTVASFSYTLDKVGNRTRMVDTEGTTLYEYDKLYRLTAVTYPDAMNVVYQYDPMGNRLSMATNSGTTTYTYDAADRLLTAGATAFTWDADGNMLTKGGQTFTYDAVNRLTQVVSGTLTVGFAYDGDGRRASKTVNGTATGYVYDTIAGLAYVLAEQTGGDITLYTYGADLLAMTDPAGAQSYYHADGLGSTRGLTNGSGQVTARYTYDVFGAVRSSGGAGNTAFKFAGEQTDDESGLIYLRARYYDPSLARFLSKDLWRGSQQDTQSLNRYVYVKNNPTNQVDPSGAIFEMLAEKWQNIKYNVTHPREYVQFMKEALSDPVARGFVLDEISENMSIVGVSSCAVGFGPGCAFFSTGSKLVDLVNLADTTRGIAAGEVPTFVGSERAFKVATSLVTSAAFRQVGGAIGVSSWRLGTRNIGTKAGGLIGQFTSYAIRGGLEEVFRETGLKDRLAGGVSDLFLGLMIGSGNSGGSSTSGDDGAGAGSTGSPYTWIMDTLQKSGFNPASPQPPPSHSK
jgi:RHS repeat-associated protein